MMHATIAISLMALPLLACQAKGSSPAAPTASQPASTALGQEGLREQIYQKARQRNGGKEPSQLDLWNEFVQQAKEEAGAAKPTPEPRIVQRGARPEIVIKGSQITFEGKVLRIGEPLSRWKQVLPQDRRCSEESAGTAFCIWPSLALDVGTDHRDRSRVQSFTVHLNLEPKDPYAGLVTQLPDGTPIKPQPDWSHKKAFPGYLELDGFGIDAMTKFWEIRSRADPKRKLRCGLRDCSHPMGLLGESVKLYLRLNRNDEQGNVYEFNVTAD